MSGRESTRELELEQSGGFRNLDRAIQIGVQSILEGQNAIGVEATHQLDIARSNSAQQHVETREIIQKNQDQIIDRFYRLQSNMPGLPLEGYLNAKLKLKAGEEEKNAKEKLLAALVFEVMTDRREQIKDSYRQTFEWIFKEPKSKI